MTGRTLAFIYGFACYAITMATFLAFGGFLIGVGPIPHIDAVPTTPLALALAINLGLIGLFALQHSGMARPGFKKVWTRVVPKSVERSTYCLLSSIATLLIVFFWQPMGGIVWSVTDPTGVAIAYSLYALGWIFLVGATFMINHFDLFGLRQIWLNLMGREYAPLEFKTIGAYRYIRHPLYVGWFTIMWATPTMTLAHLVLAVATTAYVLAAIQLEERDLANSIPEYTEYKRRVPMFVPSVKGGTTAEDVRKAIQVS